MDSNWDNLRYFNALARHGTLSKAAFELGVSHSTVQRHVVAFESELNVQLFNHTTTGYKLTVAGKSLYRETTTIQQTLRAISSRIADNADAVEGGISITASDTIGHFLLPGMLKSLQERYPLLELSVVVGNQLSSIQDLEADIAIRSGIKPRDDLIGRQVGTLRFAVCGSELYLQNHKLNKQNAVATAAHIISLDKSFSGTHFYDWQPKSQVERQTTRVNGFLSAYQLCKAGLGVALLPAYILQHDPQLVELECDTVPEGNSLWVLSHADLRDSSKVKAVRHYLAEQLSEVFG